LVAKTKNKGQLKKKKKGFFVAKLNVAEKRHIFTFPAYGIATLWTHALRS
jgi:hypothetical protein